MGIINILLIVLVVVAIIYLLISGIIMMSDFENEAAYINTKIGLIAIIFILLLCIICVAIVDVASQKEGPGWQRTEPKLAGESHLLSLGDAAYTLEDEKCYYVFVNGDENPRQCAKKDVVVVYDSKEPYIETRYYKIIFYCKKVPLFSTWTNTMYIIHLTSEDDIQNITPYRQSWE